jgi:rhodanese-related sulfurtransferase
MQHISATQLARHLAEAADSTPPLLLDVREPWEFELCHIADSQPLPMNSLPGRLAELDPQRPTVVICHHGHRSLQVAAYLERNGFTEVTNLTGGVAAWAQQVQPTMPQY